MHWQFFQMLLEQHICMKFCYKMGKTCKETYDLLKVALSDGALKFWMVQTF
jgi:hypothetical protein